MSVRQIGIIIDRAVWMLNVFILKLSGVVLRECGFGQDLIEN